MNIQFPGFLTLLPQIDPIDENGSPRRLHLLVSASQFIEAFSAHLDCRKKRSLLADLSDEFRQDLVSLLWWDPRCCGFFEDPAVSIKGVSGYSQSDFGKVLLVTGLKETCQASGSPKHQSQYSVGHRIQCSRMPYFDPEEPSDLLHNVVGGGPGGLVDDQCSIQFHR